MYENWLGLGLKRTIHNERVSTWTHFKFSSCLFPKCLWQLEAKFGEVRIPSSIHFSINLPSNILKLANGAKVNLYIAAWQSGITRFELCPEAQTLSFHWTKLTDTTKAWSFPLHNVYPRPNRSMSSVAQRCEPDKHTTMKMTPH